MHRYTSTAKDDRAAGNHSYLSDFATRTDVLKLVKLAIPCSVQTRRERITERSTMDRPLTNSRRDIENGVYPIASMRDCNVAGRRS
jgi:hypothetical protein